MLEKMSVKRYKAMQQAGKFSRKVYACPVCFERLAVTRQDMRITKAVYFCSRRHPVTWETAIMFDSKNEFRAWHEFLLNKENWNLRHHVKFQIQPEQWERLEFDSYKKVKDTEMKDKGFNEWYMENVGCTLDKPTNSAGWIHTKAEYYESDITFEDKTGLRVVEVKGLDKKTNRPYFPGNESEKKLARIAEYLEGWNDLRLEVYAGGLWFDFNEKWQLVQRGGV